MPRLGCITRHRSGQLLEGLRVADRLRLGGLPGLALLLVHPTRDDPSTVQANGGRERGEEEQGEPTEVRERLAELG